MSSEEESEVAKVAREDKQRKELINDAMKELELFHLRHDEERESDTSEEDSFEQREIVQSHPPGVKFFCGDVNCIFNQDSVKNELNIPWCNYEHLDLTTLLGIERTIQHKYLIETFNIRKIIFKSFYKLLFTYQSREYLDTVSSILLKLASKTNQTNVLLQISLETLPLGIKNLGGQVNKVFTQNEVDEIPDINESTVRARDEPHLSIVDNIQYLVNILQYLFTKENSFAKGKLNMSDVTIDNLVLLLMIISQDPAILRSNIIVSIQNLLASVLDLYPDSSSYASEQVLNIVQRMVLYWDTSPEEFNHHTACFLTCDVPPRSIRGKQLRASLALCVIMCCLTPNEVEAFDNVKMETLAKFCSDHTRELADLDCYAYYSVVRLIDAAISRPFRIEHDGPHLLDLQETVNACSNKENRSVYDWYYQPRLKALMQEITIEWNRFLKSEDEEVGHKRKLP